MDLMHVLYLRKNRSSMTSFQTQLTFKIFYSVLINTLRVVNFLGAGHVRFFVVFCDDKLHSSVW